MSDDYAPWSEENPFTKPLESEGVTSAALRRADELRARLLDSEGLDSQPGPEPLIDGIIYRNSLAWLHGKPGSAKSFVALDWAACVAAGLSWQGHATVYGPVLYVIAEGSAGMGPRKRAWEEQARERMGVTFLPVAVQISSSTDMGAVVIIAAEIKPVLIVFDTQARVTVGMDENSSRDMGLMVEAAEQLREVSGACVLFVHHESRGGENPRGSTAIEGAAMSQIRAKKDGVNVTLENPKQKEAAEFDPIRLVLKPLGESAVLTSGSGETSESQQKIMTCMRETFGETLAVSPKDIAETTGLSRTTCFRALKALVIDGFLVNVGTAKRPMYQIPGGAGQ